MSYLFRIGLDPNSADSLSNSVMSYAAAYAWVVVVELLLQNDAEPDMLNT